MAVIESDQRNRMGLIGLRLEGKPLVAHTDLLGDGLPQEFSHAPSRPASNTPRGQPHDGLVEHHDRGALLEFLKQHDQPLEVLTSRLPRGRQGSTRRTEMSSIAWTTGVLSQTSRASTGSARATTTPVTR